MTIRRTSEDQRNAAASALLDPALSSARDALQRFLEKALRTQFGANWQETLERDRMGGAPRGQSDRWDWGSISYRLGHFRSAQVGTAGGVVTESVVALARLAKAYRNQFQHEALSDAQVRHAVEGLALLNEALGNRAAAQDTRKALEIWSGGAKRTRSRKAPAAAPRKAAGRTATRGKTAKRSRG